MARTRATSSPGQPQPSLDPAPAQAKSVKYLTLESNNGCYVNLWLPFGGKSVNGLAISSTSWRSALDLISKRLLTDLGGPGPGRGATNNQVVDGYSTSQPCRAPLLAPH